MTWQQAVDELMESQPRGRWAHVCRDGNPDVAARDHYRKVALFMRSPNHGVNEPEAGPAHAPAKLHAPAKVLTPPKAHALAKAPSEPLVPLADSLRAVKFGGLRCRFASKDPGCGCSGFRCAFLDRTNVTLKDCITCPELGNG